MSLERRLGRISERKVAAIGLDRLVTVSRLRAKVALQPEICRKEEGCSWGAKPPRRRIRSLQVTGSRPEIGRQQVAGRLDVLAAWTFAKHGIGRGKQPRRIRSSSKRRELRIEKESQAAWSDDGPR